MSSPKRWHLMFVAVELSTDHCSMVHTAIGHAGELFNHECRREVGYTHRTTSAVLSIHHTVRDRTIASDLFPLQKHSMEISPDIHLGLDGYTRSVHSHPETIP